MEGERGNSENVSALSAGAYTATLYVIGLKGGGLAPPPSPARADFSIMMECTPEIGNLQSVCTLWLYLWKCLAQRPNTKKNMVYGTLCRS
jgi:hypothetical protein